MSQFLRKLPALISAGLLISLSGCSQVQGVFSESQTPRVGADQIDRNAVYVAGGDAAANEPYFLLTAQNFADSGEEIAGQAFVNAFVAAGFDKANMQVSFDKTPLEYKADSLFLSVRFESECLIAQIGQAERDIAVERTTAVGPEKNLCLIGETRPIDW